MAIPINMEELLHQRVIESARIEYKTDWNPAPILHSITAFANDFDNLGGGYIMFRRPRATGIQIPQGAYEDALTSSRRISQQMHLSAAIHTGHGPVLIDGRHSLFVGSGEMTDHTMPGQRIHGERSPRRKAYYIRRF